MEIKRLLVELEPKYPWIKQEIINNESKWAQLYVQCACLLWQRLNRLKYLKELPTKESSKLLIPYYQLSLSESFFFAHFYNTHIGLELAATDAKGDLNYFCFLGGWLLLQKNSPRLTPLVFALKDHFIKQEENINANSLLGDFLRTFPNFPEATRHDAAQRLREKHFQKPIHNKRWIKYERRFLEEIKRLSILYKTTPENAFNREVISSIINVFNEIGDYSLGDLYEKPNIIKSKIGNLVTTSLLGGKYWQKIIDHLPIDDDDVIVNTVDINTIINAHFHLIERSARERAKRLAEKKLQNAYLRGGGAITICSPKSEPKKKQREKKIRPEFVRPSKLNWQEIRTIGYLGKLGELAAKEKCLFDSALNGNMSVKDRMALSRLRKKLREK